MRWSRRQVHGKLNNLPCPASCSSTIYEMTLRILINKSFINTSLLNQYEEKQLFSKCVRNIIVCSDLMPNVQFSQCSLQIRPG